MKQWSLENENHSTSHTLHRLLCKSWSSGDGTLFSRFDMPIRWNICFCFCWLL